MRKKLLPKIICLRISRAEHREWKRLARQYELTLSALIRELVNDQIVAPAAVKS